MAINYHGGRKRKSACARLKSETRKTVLEKKLVFSSNAEQAGLSQESPLGGFLSLRLDNLGETGV